MGRCFPFNADSFSSDDIGGMDRRYVRDHVGLSLVLGLFRFVHHPNRVRFFKYADWYRCKGD